MDVTEFCDYFQQPVVTPNEPNSLLNQTIEESTPLPPFSSLCSSDLENMLNALFPTDETLRNHLDYTAGYPGDDNNDHDMSSRYDPLERLLETSTEYENQIPTSNGTSHNYQGNNFSTTSVLETLDQLLASSFITNQIDSSSSSNASPPNDTFLTSYSSLAEELSPVEPLNGSPVAETMQELVTWPSQLRRPYTDNQSNVLSPIDPGFKPALTLSNDMVNIKEPWKPNVAKKILSAFYTPLSFKSEFMATQVVLDEFQCLAMKEAVAAFHDVALRNCVTYSIGEEAVYPDSCPVTLVGTCVKIRAYRRLHFDDKVTLLSDVFLDLVAMKSVLTYDHLTDSWTCSGKRIDRREIFRLDNSLHNGIVRVIETFPDRWRNDLTIAALIYLVIIFNPDLPNLKFSEAIRLEQYSYIYLLQRYLETVCESPSDASDYHYRLMVKIEEIQDLRQNMANVFNVISVGFVGSLKGRISGLVQYNELT